MVMPWRNRARADSQRRGWRCGPFVLDKLVHELDELGDIVDGLGEEDDFWFDVTLQFREVGIVTLIVDISVWQG